MTILVDPALWSWRGDRWSHLVSDSSLDELHDFAARLGRRRFSFQGDHYDIPTRFRERAIELGAEPVDTRALARRLRRSGLRLPPSRRPPAWSIRYDGELPTGGLAHLPVSAPAPLVVAVEQLGHGWRSAILATRRGEAGVLLTGSVAAVRSVPNEMVLGVDAVHRSEPFDAAPAVELMLRTEDPAV